MPLHEHRRRLADLLADNDLIRFSGYVEGAKGAALFQRDCAMGLEGIVSKRIDSPIDPGRSSAGAKSSVRETRGQGGPARWGWRASCRSGSTCPADPGRSLGGAR
jgi:hypothetical protein